MVLGTRSNPWRDDTSQVETAHEFGVTTWRDEHRNHKALITSAFELGMHAILIFSELVLVKHGRAGNFSLRRVHNVSFQEGLCQETSRASTIGKGNRDTAEQLMPGLGCFD